MVKRTEIQMACLVSSDPDKLYSLVKDSVFDLANLPVCSHVSVRAPIEKLKWKVGKSNLTGSAKSNLSITVHPYAFDYTEISVIVRAT